MNGILTDEDRAREIAAYVRELNQNEGRLASLPETHADRERVQQTIDGIHEQLRLRGYEAAAPHRRAAKRDRAGQEVR